MGGVPDQPASPAPPVTRAPVVDAPSITVDFGGIGFHPGQLEVLNDPHRFKLLRAGRRWRKTSIGIVQAFTGYRGADRKFRGALDGGHIGWWVPSMTARYIVQCWIPIRSIAAQIPGTVIEEANHRVVLPGGGSILVLTGENVDSGRGLGLDGAVIEEAAIQLELLWTETIRATLIDRRGWAMFLFTPKGMNWIWQLEEDLPNLGDDWTAFHYRSGDNPTIDRDELDALTREMSSIVQLQEIEAEYVSAGAGVFRAEWFRHWYARDADGQRFYMLGDNPVASDDMWRFHTVDLAWTLEEDADYTVISSWGVTKRNHMLLLNVIRGRFEGPDIIPRMRVAYEMFGGHFVVERATRQMHIVQEAVRSGLPVREVKAEKDKVARALPTTARMEQGTIWFPPPTTPFWREIEGEILAFPAGRHDDFVDTMSYATAEVGRGASAYDAGGLLTD